MLWYRDTVGQMGLEPQPLLLPTAPSVPEAVGQVLTCAPGLRAGEDRPVGSSGDRVGLETREGPKKTRGRICKRKHPLWLGREPRGRGCTQTSLWVPC